MKKKAKKVNTKKVKTNLHKVHKKLGLMEYRYRPGVYNYTVIIIVGKEESVPAFIKGMRDVVVDVPDAKGICYVFDKYAPILWIPRNPKTPEELGTLAHEVVHIMSHFSVWIGTKINPETDELFAHFTSYLISQFLTDIKHDNR